MADCIEATLRWLLEYNSTTRLSLMSGRISPRSGRAFRTPENFFSSTSTQSGTDLATDLEAACTRACFCAFSRSVTTSPGPHCRKHVHDRAVHRDAAMAHELARSLRVAAKPMR